MQFEIFQRCRKFHWILRSEPNGNDRTRVIAKGGYGYALQSECMKDVRMVMRTDLTVPIVVK